jgi:hypothetical protein
MTKRDEAIKLAFDIIENPLQHPDSNVFILAIQLLREVERARKRRNTRAAPPATDTTVCLSALARRSQSVA